jgi:hypothetical protein
VVVVVIVVVVVEVCGGGYSGSGPGRRDKAVCGCEPWSAITQRLLYAMRAADAAAHRKRLRAHRFRLLGKPSERGEAHAFSQRHLIIRYLIVGCTHYCAMAANGKGMTAACSGRELCVKQC